MLGKNSLAIEDFRKSLSLNNSIVTLFRLSRILYEEKDEEWKFLLEEIFIKDPLFRVGRLFRASKLQRTNPDQANVLDVILIRRMNLQTYLMLVSGYK